MSIDLKAIGLAGDSREEVIDRVPSILELSLLGELIDLREWSVVGLRSGIRG